MDGTTPGKRLEQGAPQKRPLAAIVIGIVAAVLAVAYLGLCVYAGAAQNIFPNVYVAGINVGGMTRSQAEEALTAAVDGVKNDLSVSLVCGNWHGTLPPDGIQAAAAETAQQAWICGRGNFLAQGFQMLWHALGGSDQAELIADLNDQGQSSLSALLADADRTLSDRVIQPTWSVEGDRLILVSGVPGRSIDPAATEAAIETALAQELSALLAGSGRGTAEIPLSAVETAPDVLDLQEVYDKVYTEAKDAEFDVTSRTIVPHVTGLSFDAAAAQAQLNDAAEGQRLAIPLTLTEPQMTTERLESHLFSDVLGECTTNVNGTAARVSNVTLAAERCNEYILLPGEVFSYNDTVGPRTLETGFKPAPAYVQGATVDEVGGGICQMASTLYLATLRSNLEIVERRNHSYVPTYVTIGMDATVAYNAIDFRFKNDTNYPIKIQSSVNKRVLTVKILGAKTDDITVKMTYSVLSSTPAGVIYRADESIPVGTTKVSVTAYTGYKVVVYRNLYDGDGNLISSTQENVSNYKSRDKVILYNPADAGTMGIPSSGGTSTPDPTPSAEPTPTPSPDPTPSVSPTTPPETQPPAESTDTPSPTPSAEPSPSAEPAPSVQPTPEASFPPVEGE